MGNVRSALDFCKSHPCCKRNICFNHITQWIVKPDTEQETPSLKMPPYCRSMNTKKSSQKFIPGAVCSLPCAMHKRIKSGGIKKKYHTGGRHHQQQPEMEEAITQAVSFPHWVAAVSCTYLFTSQLTRCEEKTLPRTALNVVPFLLNLHSWRMQRWLQFAYKKKRRLLSILSLATSYLRVCTAQGLMLLIYGPAAHASTL